jgi:predicted MPP superfamily phosphohydrolase
LVIYQWKKINISDTIGISGMKRRKIMRKTDFTEYIIADERFGKDFEGFKFIMLSDLHSNEYGVDLHEVNRTIKEYTPDAILIAGDMFNRRPEENITQVLNYLISLAKHYQVFYALGNHEYSLKMADGKMREKYEYIYVTLAEAGVCFLQDETVYLEKNGNKIALSGVEIDSVFYKFRHPVMGKGLIESHLGVADKGVYNILIAHNPEYFANYAKWGADLVLSGHIHGGIIRLPYVGGIVSTTRKLLPHFDSGLYKSLRGRKMIISRGMGTHTINVRINNRPEIVGVKILAKN